MWDRIIDADRSLRRAEPKNTAHAARQAPSHRGSSGNARQVESGGQRAKSKKNLAIVDELIAAMNVTQNTHTDCPCV